MKKKVIGNVTLRSSAVRASEDMGSQSVDGADDLADEESLDSVVDPDEDGELSNHSDPPVSKEILALVFGALFFIVEIAYFSGQIGNASGDEIGLLVLLFFLAIPLGILASGAALFLLFTSLLARNLLMRMILVVLAVGLQIFLWPDAPKCNFSSNDCSDPLATYKFFVILFWVASAAFHILDFSSRAQTARDRNPYYRKIRLHNSRIRSAPRDD